jgi:hypothetical protein
VQLVGELADPSAFPVHDNSNGSDSDNHPDAKLQDADAGEVVLAGAPAELLHGLTRHLRDAASACRPAPHRPVAAALAAAAAALELAGEAAAAAAAGQVTEERARDLAHLLAQASQGMGHR